MSRSKTILITGASGNLGGKLRRHLEGNYVLKLLDIQQRGDEEIIEANFGVWDEAWAHHFEGVDTVVHLAANPSPIVQWADLIEDNIDSLVNVFAATVKAGVRRMVYASSNHAMGGYKAVKLPEKVTTNLPQKPGMHFERDGKAADSIAYGAAKLMGERIGKCYADIHGLSVIAVRIGWVNRGENLASSIPAEYDPWLRLMWLSNRDYCQLMTRCIEADASIGFAVVNGMSNNTGMRWDIEETRRLIGYEPQDDITR